MLTFEQEESIWELRSVQTSIMARIWDIQRRAFVATNPPDYLLHGFWPTSDWADELVRSEPKNPISMKISALETEYEKVMGKLSELRRSLGLAG